MGQLAVDARACVVPSRMRGVDRDRVPHGPPEDLAGGGLSRDAIDRLEGDRMVRDDQAHSFANSLLQNHFGECQAGQDSLDGHGRVTGQKSNVIPTFCQAERSDSI